MNEVESFVLWIGSIAVTAFVSYWVIRVAVTHALRDDRRERRREGDWH